MYNLYSLAAIFPLPWTHYARLIRLRNVHAREFYEIEALRGGAGPLFYSPERGVRIVKLQQIIMLPVMAQIISPSAVIAGFAVGGFFSAIQN